MLMNEFQRLCGIPDTPANPVFRQLWETVKLHLQNEPDNSTGVAGPGKMGTQFDSWAVDYLDSGIGQQYWGPRTEGKWKLEKDRAHIVKFFRKLVLILAQKERGRRLKEVLRRAIDTESQPEDGEEGTSEGTEGGEDEEWEEGEENSELEELKNGQIGVRGGIGDRYLKEENQNKNDTEEPYEPPPLATKIPAIQRGLRSFKAPVDDTDRFVGSERSSMSGASTLLSSIRKYVLESTSTPPPKRLRRSEPIPQDAEGELEIVVGNHTLPCRPNKDRVFETRLGDHEAIAFVFAPWTIAFQEFYTRFCEVWRKDTGETDIENVEVIIRIAGAGRYQLSFGVSRQRSWLHIMSMAEKIPGSNILVTMTFDQCTSYCKQISAK